MVTEDVVTEGHVSLGSLMRTGPDLVFPRRMRADDTGEGSRDLQKGSAERPQDPEDHQEVTRQKSHLAMSAPGNEAHASGDTIVGKPIAPFDGCG